MSATSFSADAALIHPEVRAQLHELSAIDLGMLEGVALLNRIDTKYVLSDLQAAQILDRCRRSYSVLEVEGRRASLYSTQYFDTARLSMYYDHHNGLRDRYKVRLRAYLESGTTWLEIKRKTNLERTVKRRLPLATADPESYAQVMGLFTEEEGYFIRESTPYDPADLYPSANNEFFRVTLASTDPNMPERITVDFALRLRWQEHAMALPGIAIAEVKRPRAGGSSPFVDAAHALHVDETPFSKYCMTIALLVPNIRRNLFKEPLRQVEHVMRMAERYTEARYAETRYTETQRREYAL